MKVCDKPTTKDGARLFSLAHDVMSWNRDRNFQDIDLLLWNTEIAADKHVVRISDLEWQHNKTMFKVYQFGDAEQQTGLEVSISRLVWR